MRKHLWESVDHLVTDFSKCIFPNYIFPKWFFPKNIFVKCTRCMHLLSFASLFLRGRLQKMLSRFWHFCRVCIWIVGRVCGEISCKNYPFVVVELPKAQFTPRGPNRFLCFPFSKNAIAIDFPPQVPIATPGEEPEDPVCLPATRAHPQQPGSACKVSKIFRLYTCVHSIFLDTIVLVAVVLW